MEYTWCVCRDFLWSFVFCFRKAIFQKTSAYDDSDDYFLTSVLVLARYRGRRPELFCKKSVLKNFAKLIVKYLCLSIFYNKVAGLRASTLLKKRLQDYFLWIFAKFLRTPIVVEHLWWLLLMVPSAILQILYEFLIFCYLFHELQGSEITAKYVTRVKYSPMLHGSTVR